MKDLNHMKIHMVLHMQLGRLIITIVMLINLENKGCTVGNEERKLNKRNLRVDVKKRNLLNNYKFDLKLIS